MLWVLLFWGVCQGHLVGRAAGPEAPPRARRHPGDGDISTSSTGTGGSEPPPAPAHARGFGFCGRCGWKARAHLRARAPPTRGSPRGNDPSAGSPTETLLRLHLPLNDKVYLTFHGRAATRTIPATIREVHRTIQSVGATGGVYKGQGRNQCKLMTCAY